MKTMLEWKAITRNHWRAKLPGTGLSIEVTRNRSWKTLRHDFPFRLVILGQQFGWPDYAFLDEAMAAAEKHAKVAIRKLAAWAKSGAR